MSPLLGAGDFLSWSRTLPPERLPQAGDLDRAPSPDEPDPIVFGDWHPPSPFSFWAHQDEP